jgi:hypothetical protein
MFLKPLSQCTSATREAVISRRITSKSQRDRRSVGMPLLASLPPLWMATKVVGFPERDDSEFYQDISPQKIFVQGCNRCLVVAVSDPW